MGAACERAVFGALSGIAATMAMTAAMRRLEPLLPPAERYPLPPSELLSRSAAAMPARRHRLATVAAHFGFGAAAGALFALLPRPIPGPAFGVAVWAASYLGWIPAAGLLRPAYGHPMRRNLLMVAAHLVWGGALGNGLRELDRTDGIFRAGDAPDARPPVLQRR